MLARKIGIIGAGRLGCSIAYALYLKGYPVAGVYSKSAESQAYLCSKLNQLLNNDLTETVKQSDVIFITVPDSQIAIAAADIARKVGQSHICGKFFFHMSGALTSDELISIRRQGGYTGSLHPIQSIADKDTGWKVLDDIYFGFEGCDGVKNMACNIVDALNSRILTLKKEDKTLYHTAACILSNYMVTLSYITGTLLNGIGIDGGRGIRAFIPLMENTLGNIRDFGCENALTGPVSRGDVNVVEGHIKALSEKGYDAVVNLYKTLGLATTEIALARGSIDENAAGKLKEILAEGTKS